MVANCQKFLEIKNLEFANFVTILFLIAILVRINFYVSTVKVDIFYKIRINVSNLKVIYIY